MLDISEDKWAKAIAANENTTFHASNWQRSRVLKMHGIGKEIRKYSHMLLIGIEIGTALWEDYIYPN